MRRFQGVFVVLLLISAGSVYAWDSDDVSIHGFASTGFMWSDHYNFLVASEDGSFEFNEVGLNFGAAIRDNMRIGLQLYSFDLGEIGNNEIKLDWAFIDYEWKEPLSVKAGKIKTPFGLYNEAQDYDMLHTAVLFPQGIYSKNMRESLISFQGINVYGKISLGWAGKFDYDLFLGTSEIDTDGGVAKLISRGGLIFKSGKMDYLAGNRIKWHTPLKGLNFCGSFIQFQMKYFGQKNFPLSTFNPALPDQLTVPVNVILPLNNAYTYILSVEYSFENLLFAGEYYGLISRESSYLDLSTLGGGARVFVGEEDSRLRSCYALLSYRFNDWFEAGTYYSIYVVDEDFDSTDLINSQKDFAFSARFDINESWLVKLEVHFMGGAAYILEADNPDKENDLESHWTLYAIKTTFNF